MNIIEFVRKSMAIPISSSVEVAIPYLYIQLESGCVPISFKEGVVEVALPIRRLLR